jgi:lipid-A-disaccharide synthase
MVGGLNSPNLKLALVAGEASGDFLGQLFLQAAQQDWPQLHSYGIGGAKMAATGFEAWWPYEDLAVFGYVDALRNYRRIMALRKRFAAKLLQPAHRPDIFIGIDAPDFNLGLETQLKAQGIKTLHFVSPSIWAWRPERIKKIRAAADHVLCLFPFEPAIYEQAGIPATFVGHPFAAHIPLQPDRSAARTALNLPLNAPIVALLPGSRKSEITHLALDFFAAAQLMLRAMPSLHFICPCVPAQYPLVVDLAARAGLGDALTVVQGRSHEALAACDTALVASGTATLEAALFKRPHVIAYRMNWLNWQLIRRKRLQPWVGLPNILCQDFVVPELLQTALTPRALADAALAQLQNPTLQASIAQRFTALHHSLLQPSTQRIQGVLQQLLAP